MLSSFFEDPFQAILASWFGDDTAKQQGRVTLNPLAHIDPFGTILLPFLIGFGWAKPVPVNFKCLRPYKLGVICVSIAGIVMNLLLAISFSILYRWAVPDSEFLRGILQMAVL